MKKHLLLILALLAFVLPARAATELLFNFTQNSTASDRGTSFSNNASVTAVISNVSYGDTYNVTDYVSSLTGVSNAYYNSKGGLHLGPNGTVTVNLKNTYKVVKYEVMGPTPTQHSSVNTSATVTVNGHTYSGVNAAGSANWNRVQYEPTATENVSSFTIKAGSTDVYIKSIHIYLEAESDFTAPKFVPNGGRVKKGQTITVVNCEPSRLPQMDVTYGSNNVANHTGDFTFTFEETGTFDCWATAHSSTWSDYSETTEVSFEVYEDTPTPATLSVNPVSGTYSAPQTISISSSKADDEIYVTLTDQNNNSLVDDTFTGSWTYILSNPGTYTLSALNNDNSEINEIYTISGDTPTPATLSVNPAGGTYHYPKTVTITSSKSDDEFSVLLKNQNVTLVDNNFTGSWTYTFPGLGTYTLYAFNSDDSEINETYIITGDPCPIEITPAGTIITTGTKIKVASSVSDATLKIMVTKDGETFVEENFFDNPYIFTPTATGTYVVTAVASATGYIDTERSATYTVTAPVREEVAPVISFSHEDQKVFGSEEEIDVTLTLNRDVYPVPDVIYYTLDGFMAHNTLETGTPGATPAGHVLTVAVDPATLSGTVRIERSHREALNHRAVTINAYAVNTAGSDVAAATYIFHDNASAQTAQYVAAPKTAANSKTYTAENVNAKQTDDYTFTISNYDSSKKYYKFQQNNTMTIAAPTGANMSKIEIAWSNKGSNARTIKVTEDGKTGSDISIANTVSSGTITWEGSANTVVLKHNGGTQFFFKSFTITADAGLDAVATPTITGAEEGAIYNEDVTVTVSCETEGASITLTDNGTAVTLNNGQYTVTGFTKHTLVAKATKEGMSDSKEATLSFTIKDPNAQTVQYVKATEVKEGDEIIILSKGSNNNWYVMKTSTSGNPPAIAAPTGFDGQIIDDDDNYQKFTVVKEGDKFYLMNGTKYLYNSGSGTGLQANSTTKAAIVFFPTDKTNTSDIKVNSRYVRMYNNNDFRAYTDNNNGTYAYIFKKYTPTTPTVDTPEIALNDRAGDTTKPVTATISCSTDGADVHYSVKKDGVETVADEVYSAALTFTEAGSYELTAWATKDGMTASAKASESFTITLPVCQAPAFEPLTGAEAFNSLTVKLSCATEGAQIQYKVNNGEQKVYDDNTGIVLEGVGVYTITAWATKEGMTKSAEVTATYTVKAEPVEELFFVMDQNLWDVDGAYPETVVPFVYDRENGWYDLDIASIPATGWRQTAEGWFEINGGFRGNFYVRDGKANRKGLVFGAAGTVANTTYATRAAADGNQLVEPGVEYNMYIAGEGDTHKVFTTIGDDTNSKAFSAGTIRVTHTPGNKDAAKPMTLQILANSDQTTGVDSITAEDAASDADARFFNLQGVEVPADRLAPGIYIRQAGSKATKVLVK